MTASSTGRTWLTLMISTGGVPWAAILIWVLPLPGSLRSANHQTSIKQAARTTTEWLIMNGSGHRLQRECTVPACLLPASAICGMHRQTITTPYALHFLVRNACRQTLLDMTFDDFGEVCKHYKACDSAQILVGCMQGAQNGTNSTTYESTLIAETQRPAKIRRVVSTTATGRILFCGIRLQNGT